MPSYDSYSVEYDGERHTERTAREGPRGDGETVGPARREGSDRTELGADTTALCDRLGDMR